MLALGSIAPSAGALDFEAKGLFGSDGTSTTGFGEAGPVAVDQAAERVYVLNMVEGALYKFDLDGNPVNFGGANPNVSGNKLSGLSVSSPTLGKWRIAVDPSTHTIYLPGDIASGRAQSLYAFKSNGDPSEFAATGTNKITGFFDVQGIAVDSNGNIYVGAVKSGVGGGKDLNVYQSSGTLLIASAGTSSTVPSVQGPKAIAIDSKGVVYVQQSGGVFPYVPSEYPINGETSYTKAPAALEAASPRSVAVDLLTNRVFVLQFSPEERVRVFNEEGVAEGTFAGPGQEGQLSRAYGLAVGNVEEAGIVGPITRPFVTVNPEGGLAQTQIFQEELCICAPSVESTSAERVTGDSAVLRGKVNPNNRDTSVWFEYGLEPCNFGGCAKVPLLSIAIGHGRKGVVATQGISGLEAESVYHYRVVAVNAIDTTEGPDKTFLTQGAGLGFGLSDARSWEMVSPAQKHGGTLINSGQALIQASASGDGLVYASRGSIVEEPAGNYLPDFATVLAKRAADGTWGSEDLTPKHQEAGRTNGATTPFKVFSPELLRAAMEPADKTPLSPEASERTPYLWSDGGGSPTFTPLVSPANVEPPGTEFGPTAEGLSNPVRLEGASPDAEHFVVRSQLVPLLKGAVPNSIYMWSEGELALISRLPESEGGGAVIGMTGSGQGSVRHAASEDGSRVFWTPSEQYSVNGPELPSLYISDTIAGRSTRLDVAEPGVVGTGLARPAFNIASADGSVVFFTDSQQLTSNASPSGRDLYRCEIGPVEGGLLGCADLTDISAPLETLGGSAEVQDQVSGASEDGTRLYFVARGALDEAPNEGGEVAEPGEPNLYYWQEGEGNQFIATLSEEDRLVWGAIPEKPAGYAERISASVSPSGRYFAFTSERSLTGYENRNNSDEANTEAFVYDAESGQLTCVSCNPTGAAAVGELMSNQGKVSLPDPQRLWTNRWVAATLPEAVVTETTGRSLYRPRSVLNNGRVFFNAVDPLVSADSNGNWDVYQYQPVGVGTCAANTNTGAVTRSGNGCVGLLSSGTADGDAGFLDASPSGDDIFFLTTGRLSVLDRDNEVDAYDARVNGIAAVLNPAQECAGEACQPSVGPPNDPTPASEAFRGAETPVNCRKGQRKVQRNGKPVCVRKKQKKHGKQQKKKRAGHNRRAGR